MSLTRILPIVALIITLTVPAVVSAQVPVEVSSEKVVSGGRVYFMHEVQKNQTLYSIAKAYRVTVDAITRENVIPPNGIQTGQVLRIPAPEQQTSAASQSRPVVQPSATSSQARSAAQQAHPVASSVPGINISNERVVYGGKSYFMHEVRKGQTLYSIARAYKVTILDIDRENSIPPGGLQEGQTLRIPVSSALTLIQENAAPAGAVAQPGVNASGGTAVPKQDVPRQETQLPRQETQLPRQEQAAPATETKKPETGGTVTMKTVETKETTGATQPETKAGTDPATGQQTASSSREEVKPKASPEKKKIHKVQKGESLADIAKKYGITVQELKQANKGVIFAMPDMRLIIPTKEEEQP